MNVETKDVTAGSSAGARGLEPAVTSFVSTFVVRVVSGKARKGSDAGKGLTGFLSKKVENVQLVDKLVQAAKLNCTASEFADFADGNYTLRNDDHHNSADAALIKKADVLKKAGALRLLRDDFSWQCSIIENIEALLECLNEAS
ncbi:hypothetical protein PLESTB_000151900 [Pleodorina starrii]|uniref:Uncharacterized protein n=1 Tax=Pleodorina starrii TaxID=330485 RepID=A0A9W6BBV5_9CHLO|nr:hypothetical protein PLESTM_000450700 [Pleodorina starrii]GLC48817.1 hypothetical protein PLESTB_000151900 [Pleodorina starrii]GLC72556.1 hypothetical protein PLESTF_001264400 [Pleodorina starrii]